MIRICTSHLYIPHLHKNPKHMCTCICYNATRMDRNIIRRHFLRLSLFYPMTYSRDGFALAKLKILSFPSFHTVSVHRQAYILGKLHFIPSAVCDGTKLGSTSPSRTSASNRGRFTDCFSKEVDDFRFLSISTVGTFRKASVDIRASILSWVIFWIFLPPSFS